MRSCLLSVILVLTNIVAYAQESEKLQPLGRIVGTVLSPEGQLVDHARVCLAITTGSSTQTSCTFFTDQDGKFQIDHLKPGTYGLHAEKPEEGYTALNQEQNQAIKITKDESFQVVTIQLRPKGGILIVKVTDKTTGQPVEGSTVSFVAAAAGRAGSKGMAKSTFQMIVPTETDVAVTVVAKGYRKWTYIDPSDPSRSVLQLAPGEQRALTIELEPSSKD